MNRLDITMVAATLILISSLFRRNHTELFEYIPIRGTIVPQEESKFYLTDAVRFYNQRPSRHTQFTPLTQGKHFWMLHSFPGKSDMVLNKSRAVSITKVYYTNNSSLYCAKVALRSFGYNLETIQFEQDASDTWKQNSIYAVLGDPPEYAQYVGIVDYSAADSAIIKRFMPYADIKSVLSSDLLPKLTTPSYYRLIYIIDIALKENVYQDMFEQKSIDPATYDVNILHNYLVSHQSSVYEHFSPITVNVPTIPFVHYEKDEFSIISFPIKNVFHLDLRNGDYVTIGNKRYLVMSVVNEQYVCATSFYATIKESTFKRDAYANKWYASYQLPEWVQETQIYLISLNRYGEYDPIRKEVTLMPLEDWDTGYSCYTNSSLLSKEACESPYDAMGNPKSQVDIWDKPCQVDSDCPFFKLNAKHGGCLPGKYCEMPLGVEQLSYRKYNQESIPICYGCAVDESDCCSKQPEPDYTFKGDLLGRMQKGIGIM